MTVIAAAIALAAGGTYLGISLSSGSAPPVSGLSPLWTDHRPAGSCLDTTTAYGSKWTMGGWAITCSGQASVAAYRLGSGAVAWTWQAPDEKRHPVVLQLSTSADSPTAVGTTGTGTTAVGATGAGTTGAGLTGVVQYTYGGGAQYLAGLDPATGRQRWNTATVPQVVGMIWTGAGRFTVVTEHGAGSANEVRVYDLGSGTLDWSMPSPAGCSVTDAVLTGSWVYAVTGCTKGQPDRLYQMSLQSGALVASAVLPDQACRAGDGYPSLWAVPGYVLSTCDDIWDSTGRSFAVIPAGGVQQRPLSWPGNLEPLKHATLAEWSFAVSDGTLYIGALVTVNAQYEESEWIAAIDLRTATMRWGKTVSTIVKFSGGAPSPMHLLGADSRGVLGVIEHVDSADGMVTGITLERLSATDGALSYGPGTTYAPGLASAPRYASSGRVLQYALTGHVLLSLPACFDIDECVVRPMTAYSTGAWPG